MKHIVRFAVAFSIGALCALPVWNFARYANDPMVLVVIAFCAGSCCAYAAMEAADKRIAKKWTR